jgi:hypothetical protein
VFSLLAQLDRPALQLSYQLDAPDAVTLFVLDEGEGASGKLAALDVHATFNGAPLRRVRGMLSRDGIRYSRDSVVELRLPPLPGRERDEAGNELGGPIPEKARAGESVLVEVWDASARWKLELPDGLVRRQIRLDSLTSNFPKKGSRIQFWVSPRTDVVERANAFRAAVQVDAKLFKLPPSCVTVEGNRLTLELPVDLPYPTAAIWGLFESVLVRPRVVACTLERCSVSIEFEPDPIVLAAHPKL